MVQLRDDVEHHIVTWAEVHRDTRILVRRLMGKGPWQGIVALTRGGLVPAAIVAREMSFYRTRISPPSMRNLRASV